MKKYIKLLIAVAIISSCEHDVARTVDFNVLFAEGNTFVAGQPVKFQITGEVDNVLFYSGTKGHEYIHRDRSELPADKIILNATFQARYAQPGALQVWRAKGLSGLTMPEDSVRFAEMVADPEKAGWTRLQYNEGKSAEETSEEYIFDQDMDDFCLAFHWCPPAEVTNQRGYWLDGHLSIYCGEKIKRMEYTDLGFTTISMNEDTHYNVKSYNGCNVKYDTRDTQIALTGKDNSPNTYKWDLWVVSKTFANFPADPDKGDVIKNVQNSLDTYEYTWNEPGTYNIVFVGTCANYLGSSEQIISMTVNIVDAIENPFN